MAMYNVSHHELTKVFVPYHQAMAKCQTDIVHGHYPLMSLCVPHVIAPLSWLIRFTSKLALYCQFYLDEENVNVGWVNQIVHAMNVEFRVAKAPMSLSQVKYDDKYSTFFRVEIPVQYRPYFEDSQYISFPVRQSTSARKSLIHAFQSAVIQATLFLEQNGSIIDPDEVWYDSLSHVWRQAGDTAEATSIPPLVLDDDIEQPFTFQSETPKQKQQRIIKFIQDSAAHAATVETVAGAYDQYVGLTIAKPPRSKTMDVTYIHFNCTCKGDSVCDLMALRIRSKLVEINARKYSQIGITWAPETEEHLLTLNTYLKHFLKCSADRPVPWTEEDVRGGLPLVPELKEAIPTMKPIRKFNQERNLIRKHVGRPTEEWKTIPNKTLFRKFRRDTQARKLYVFGAKNQLPEDFNYPLVQVLNLLDFIHLQEKTFDPESKFKKNSTQQTPMFGLTTAQLDEIRKTIDRNVKAGQDSGLEMPSYGVTYTPKQWLDSFEEAADLHKRLERHHPQEGRTLDEWETYEACVDVLNSIGFQKKSFVRAFTIWKKIFVGPHYEKLNPRGVYMFLVNLSIRQVAPFRDSFYNSDYRKATDVYLLKSFLRIGSSLSTIQNKKFPLNNPQFASLYYHFMAETVLHTTSVRIEMQRVRKNSQHDYSKYYSYMMLPYMFRWAIWEELDQVVKHQTLRMSGNEIQDMLVDSNLKEAKRIGMFATKQMMEEALDTIATTPIPALEHKRVKGEVTMKPFKSIGKAAGESLGSKFEETASRVIGEMKGTATELYSKFQESFQPLIAKTHDLIDKADGLLDSFKGVVDQVTNMLPDPFKNAISGINIGSLMHLIKNYVLYVNVDSRIIKGILIVDSLHRLGLLTLIQAYGKQFYEYIFEPKVLPTPSPPVSTNPFGEPDDEEEPPKMDLPQTHLSSSEAEVTYAKPEWMNDLFAYVENFSENHVKLMTFLVACLTSTILGYAVSSVHITGISKAIVETCKNLHWIGAGLFGIDRMLKYFNMSLTVTFQYIREHIFGLTPSKLKTERNLALWIIKVNFFATEAGMTALRNNRNAYEEASKLHSMGVAFHVDVLANPDGYSRDSKIALAKALTTSKDIDNVCYRIRSLARWVPSMFHVQFYGKPGIGKSHLTQSLVNHLGKMWFPDVLNKMYTLNTGLAFYDDYAGQPIMIVDDLFRINEPRHMTLLIELITTTVIILPMANLIDKGMQMTSEIMISSTNTPFPVAKDVYCMDAVFRRRHMLVEVTIDPKVLSDSAKAFCPMKFEENYPGQNPETFPHLRFSLVNPVFDSEIKREYLTTKDIKYFEQYIAQLSEINKNIAIPREMQNFEKTMDPKSILKPEYFKQFPGSTFLKDNPLRLVMENLTYAQLLTMIDAKFTVHRRNTPNRETKFAHIIKGFQELDMCYGMDPPDFIMKKILQNVYPLGENDDDYPYLTRNSKGEIATVLEDDLLPVPDINVDEIAQEVLSEQSEEHTVPTMHRFNPFTSPPTVDVPLVGNPAPGPSGEVPSETLIDLASDEEDEFVQPAQFPTPQLTKIVQDATIGSKKYCELRRQFLEEVKETTNPQEYAQNFSKLLDVRNFQIMQKEMMQQTRSNILDPIVQLHFNNFGYILLGNHIDYPTHLANMLDSSNGAADRPFPLFDLSKGVNSDSSGFTSDEIKGPLEHQRYLLYLKEMMALPFHIPKEPIFEEPTLYNEQGVVGKSPMSFWFLKGLERKIFAGQERWIFKYPAKFKKCSEVQLVWKKHEQEGRVVGPRSPLDMGIWLMSTHQFRDQVETFFTKYTRAQQFRMVQIAHSFPNSYFQVLCSRPIKEEITNVAKKVLQTFQPVVNGMQWLWNKMKKYWIPLTSLVVIAGAIVGIRALAKLFLGTEVTSKYMFRGKPQRVQGVVTMGTDNYTDYEQMLPGLLTRHVTQIRISNPSGEEFVAMGVRSKQYIIMNAHILQCVEDGATVSFRPSVKMDKIWSYIVSKSNIAIFPKSEVGIMYSRQFPMTKDLQSKFVLQTDIVGERPVDPQGDYTFLTHRNGEQIYDTHACYSNVGVFTLDSRDTGEQHISMGLEMMGQTYVGESGSLVTRCNNFLRGRCLYGIQAWKHRGWSGSKVYVQLVTQEMIASLLDTIDKRNTTLMVTQLGPEECEVTFHKSSQLFESHVSPIGSVPAELAQGMVARTQYRKTKIAPFMEQDGFKSKRVPAILQYPNSKLLVDQNPLKHSLNKSGTGSVGPFDPVLVQECVTELTSYCSSILDKQQFDTSLDIDSIVVGIRADGSSPMNLNASSGIPFVWDKYPQKPKGKKAYLQVDEEGKLSFSDPEFIAGFEEFNHHLQQGIIPYHSSYDFPKDELRELHKAYGNPETGSPPKTRTVTTMNVYIVMAWRRVTLDLMASLHRAAGKEFPFAPGMNPEGPDWCVLYHYINKHPNCVDFDVSNYDGHMPSTLLYAAADVIVGLLKLKPRSPQANVIYSIVTEVLFGHVQFSQTVYQKHRGMQSGFPGTAEMNSLVHMLLITYMYKKLAIESGNPQYRGISTMLHNISYKVYGDDVLLSFSDEVKEWCNGKTLAQSYINVGYPVTTADKTSEIRESKSLSECSFLKSKFRVVSPFRVDRTLDLEVILDLCYWVRAKQDPHAQFLTNINDALRFLRGHGEETYDHYVGIMNKWLKKIGCTIHTTWRELDQLHVHTNYY